MRQQSFTASTKSAFVIVAAGVLSIGAMPAEARQNAQADTQIKATGTSQVGEKKICRRIEHTGSRMAKDRVCLTREDWKKVDEETR